VSNEIFAAFILLIAALEEIYWLFSLKERSIVAVVLGYATMC